MTSDNKETFESYLMKHIDMVCNSQTQFRKDDELKYLLKQIFLHLNELHYNRIYELKEEIKNSVSHKNKLKQLHDAEIKNLADVAAFNFITLKKEKDNQILELKDKLEQYINCQNVFKDKIKELQNERVVILKKSNKFIEEIKELQEKIKSKEDMLEKVANINKELHQRLERQLKNINLRSQEKNIWFKRYNALKREVLHLREDNKELQAENKTLEGIKISAYNEITNLKKENEKLKRTQNPVLSAIEQMNERERKMKTCNLIKELEIIRKSYIPFESSELRDRFNKLIDFENGIISDDYYSNECIDILIHVLKRLKGSD